MSISSAQDVGLSERAGDGWSWTIDPVDHWTAVPADRSEPFEVVDAWEHQVADTVLAGINESLTEDLGPDDSLSAQQREQLVRQVVASVENVRTFAENVPEGTRVVVLVGVKGRGPVPVLATVSVNEPGASDDELMEALGAVGGNPLNPPNIEYLDLTEGDGIRVTRIDVDPADRSAWLTVSVGRRTEQPGMVVDTVLLWRTQDLVLAETMRDALDDLLPAVRITRSET